MDLSAYKDFPEYVYCPNCGEKMKEVDYGDIHGEYDMWQKVWFECDCGYKKTMRAVYPFAGYEEDD